MMGAALTMDCADATWTAAYERDRDRLVTLAATIIGSRDAAEDVVQGAFEKAFRHRSRLDPSLPVTAWLRRITCNESVSFLRRQRLRRVLLLGSEQPDPAPETAIADRLAVTEAVRRLDPRHRVVVGLFYLCGYSMEEVAEVLDLPSGTVGSRLHRARQLLRAILDEREGDQERRR
ncbi:MAG: RNA polymerase sigma factor [Candidatus Dormibacteria bacterium]|jgi:RNA polymerase sigma-70 factor (ECF subfamily)